MLNVFNNKNFSKRVLLFVILVIIICTSIILFLDNNTEIASFFSNIFSNSVTSKSKFAGYEKIKSEMSDLIAKDKNPSTETLKNRAYSKMITLEDNKTTDSQGYQATQDMAIFVSSLYSQTNDPSYRKILDNLGNFAKTNFSKLYNSDDFYTVCQDKSCQDEETPQEIIKIINEIKNSDMQNYIKDVLVLNLTNATYVTKTKPEVKFISYFAVVGDLKNYSQYSPSGINLSIASELQAFIDNKYAKQKQEYLEIIKKQKELKQIYNK